MSTETPSGRSLPPSLDGSSTALLRGLRADPWDDALWARFIEKNRPRVAWYVNRSNGTASDIDDVLQSLIAALLQSWGNNAGLDPGDNRWRGYLRQAVRSALDKERKKELPIAEPHAVENLVAPSDSSKEELVCEQVAQDILKDTPFWVRIARTLPKVRQEVTSKMTDPTQYDDLVAYHAEEINLQVLADRLRKFKNAAAVQASRFLKTFKEVWLKFGMESDEK